LFLQARSENVDARTAAGRKLLRNRRDKKPKQRLRDLEASHAHLKRLHERKQREVAALYKQLGLNLPEATDGEALIHGMLGSGGGGADVTC
jgi:hypothetical protein